MEIGTSDVDAQLLEKLSALGTTDKEELIYQLKLILGNEQTSDSCRFFLELAGWNLQRAVGAYFDFSFDSTPASTEIGANNVMFDSSTISQSCEMIIVPLSFDLRILQITSISPGPHCTFKVTVENCGSANLMDGCFLRSESDATIAKCATRCSSTGQLIWLPIGRDTRVSLLPMSNSHVIEITIELASPGMHYLSTHVHITGAMSFCLPSGEPFGETLYFTAIPDVTNQCWLFQQGIYENSNADADTPMEQA